MEQNTEIPKSIDIPKYSVRGFEIWGFRDMEQTLDHLLSSGPVKTGTLVAMNAEKLLKAEDDAASVLPTSQPLPLVTVSPVDIYGE